MNLGGIVRAHVVITGKVQMVGYRYATHQQAHRLNIDGWVRNLPSGQVEAVFQGKKDTVDQIIQWCYQGPTTAVVKSVSVDWEPPAQIKGFEIVDFNGSSG